MVRIARDRGLLGAGALAIASFAACGSSPLPSGPGTSTDGRSATHVRVTFEELSCLISSRWEPVQ